LREAGWIDANSDGILEKGGQPFVFEIITNQGNETRQKCAEIIQRQLKRSRHQCKNQNIGMAAFVNDFINKRRFDAVILGWTITLDPDAYDVWHSSKTAPEELNFMSYKNREADELLEKDAAHLIRRKGKNTTTVFRRYWPRISPIPFFMFRTN